MLRVLDLGSNRIECIAGLTSCGKLEELWLGKNRIQRIEGLEACPLLKRLDVQGNRLVSVGPGIAHLKVKLVFGTGVKNVIESRHMSST